MPELSFHCNRIHLRLSSDHQVKFHGIHSKFQIVEEAAWTKMALPDIAAMMLQRNEGNTFLSLRQQSDQTNTRQLLRSLPERASSSKEPS
eukprot:scaffold207977_cov55-Attheya_sp.AAC.2